MSKRPVTPEQLGAVAERFKVLAEPARLRVLNALRRGPLHVSALIEQTGLNQANLSKHLQLLHGHGFVGRRREGLFVYYEIADASVFTLCDLMCGQLERAAARRFGPFRVPGSRLKKAV
jgi:ArsR family transcriptional regulator, arsenate/arsenite/antimonite-responsive transcriptional repressor